MKIQCQSCQAKYTIADEKVLGKVVKIRCKKCSATIVINGNEQPAQAETDTHVFDYAGQSNEQWTVNVADGDQRTMTVAEIGAEYRNGVVNDETFCWKDGMADWLPLREIEPIYGLVKFGSAAARAEVVSAASLPPPSSMGAPLFAAGGEMPVSTAPHANGNGAAGLFGGAGGGLEAVASAPAAARRAGGRAQGADLFGNVEKAGGEDDVMTSAATSASAPPSSAGAGEEKLTGQRNENSVLFSLAALTEKPNEPASRTTATADGSGLIDIRALSANMDEGDRKKKDTGARVDDIMNLSGGGAFGAALAAPILAPPPLEAIDMGVMGASGAPAKQNKTIFFAILGAGALVAVAIVVAVALLRPSSTENTKAEMSTTPNAAPTEPAAPAAAVETAATEPAAAPTTDNTPPPPGTGNNAAKTGPVNPAPKAGGGGVVAAKPAEHVARAEPTPKAPEKPKDFMAAAAEAAGKKPSAPSAGGGGGSTAPFDRGAAAAALGSVNVQACKKGDGPTGAGHVTVTFGPDGSVQTAVVDSGPYPGTAVGGCVAGKYRGARVPAFGGAPVRVGKSFTIN